MHTSRCHFPSQASAIFFGVFLFWRPQSGARPAVHGDGIRYGAHRSTGFAARFQPIDRGNRELGGHGRAQTLAGDWAVQARSPAGSGSRVGRVLWRPARRIAREYCRLCTCRGWYGVQWAATSNKQLPTAGRSGSGRQPPVLDDWHSSFVTRPVRPPVRQAIGGGGVSWWSRRTGHVTDGAQQHSTHSRAHNTTGQARPVK